jgi:putative NADH-flavin reductase
MKIAVIGSTGGTGIEVVKQGVARGHSITAFARHPEKLSGIEGIGAVIKGDALNAGDVVRAIDGQDAIIAVLGTSIPARNIISAMDQLKVRKGIWVSAHPIAGTKPWILVKFAWLMFGAHYRELAITERLVMESDLDWIIVRPPRLTNGPKTGKVQIEKSNNLPSGPYSISRADLAAILLDCAESNEYNRAGLAVSASKKVSKNRDVKVTTNPSRST